MCAKFEGVNTFTVALRNYCLSIFKLSSPWKEFKLVYGTDTAANRCSDSGSCHRVPLRLIARSFSTLSLQGSRDLGLIHYFAFFFALHQIRRWFPYQLEKVSHLGGEGHEMQYKGSTVLYLIFKMRIMLHTKKQNLYCLPLTFISFAKSNK